MKVASNVKLIKIPIPQKKTYAQGIEASWASGQWVAIICNKGMVGCGAFDVKLMEAHEQVIAIARGSIERPLITCDDLLNAKIVGITKLARDLGVKEGMTGRDAIELLS
jgi:uncharacterized protein YunC (DUF1805 family)